MTEQEAMEQLKTLSSNNDTTIALIGTFSCKILQDDSVEDSLNYVLDYFTKLLDRKTKGLEK